jgi:hypothetical protein
VPRFLINNSSINTKECEMKNLLLTIVTFSVLLLIGCQENSITDPIQGTGIQKTDDPTVRTGTIALEGMLQDPHPVMNSYYIINGEIQYQQTVVMLDPIPPNPQYSVSLSLSVSADFTYLCTVCEPQSDNASVGSIAIETNDNFYVPNGGTFILRKSFPILGRDDGMVLTCSFLVTIDGVTLSELWLDLNDGNHTQNELNKNVGPDPITYPPVVRNQTN